MLAKTHKNAPDVTNYVVYDTEQPACSFCPAFCSGYFAGDDEEIMGTVI